MCMRLPVVSALFVLILPLNQLYADYPYGSYPGYPGPPQQTGVFPSLQAALRAEAADRAAAAARNQRVLQEIDAFNRQQERYGGIPQPTYSRQAPRQPLYSRPAPSQPRYSRPAPYQPPYSRPAVSQPRVSNSVARRYESRTPERLLQSSPNVPIKYDGYAETSTVGINFQPQKFPSTHGVYYRWLGNGYAEYWPYKSDSERSKRDAKVKAKIMELMKSVESSQMKKRATLAAKWRDWREAQEEKEIEQWYTSEKLKLEGKLKVEFPDRKPPAEVKTKVMAMLEQGKKERQNVLSLADSKVQKKVASFSTVSEKIKAVYKTYIKTVSQLSYKETNRNSSKLNIAGQPSRAARAAAQKEKELENSAAYSLGPVKKEFSDAIGKMNRSDQLALAYNKITLSYRSSEARKAKFIKRREQLTTQSDLRMMAFLAKFDWVEKDLWEHEKWHKAQLTHLDGLVAQKFNTNKPKDHIDGPIKEAFDSEIKARRDFLETSKKDMKSEEQARRKYREKTQGLYNELLTKSSASVDYADKEIDKLWKEELARRVQWENTLEKKYSDWKAAWRSKWGTLEAKPVEKRYLATIGQYPVITTEKERKFRLRLEFDLDRSVDFVEKPTQKKDSGTVLFEFGKVKRDKMQLSKTGLRGYSQIGDTAAFIVDNFRINREAVKNQKITIAKHIKNQTLKDAESSSPAGWLVVFQGTKLVALEVPNQKSLRFGKVRAPSPKDNYFEVYFQQSGKFVTRFAYEFDITEFAGSIKGGNFSAPKQNDPYEDGK